MPTLATNSTANATVYAVYANVYSSFNISTVVPIVASAGVIITIIIGIFAYKRSQQ